jgi:hypothetical protein
MLAAGMGATERPTLPAALGDTCALLDIGRGGWISRLPLGAIRAESLGPSCADTPRSNGAYWR